MAFGESKEVGRCAWRAWHPLSRSRRWRAVTLLHGWYSHIPAPGVSVPADNASVVFQYASTDADPLDLRSFTVTVDGVDRTARFRVTADVAWGMIADGDTAGIRAHDVRARICSVRGVCVSANAIVPVVGTPGPRETSLTKARRGRIIDVLLEMARRLLKP